jgi:hypothetical protein
MADGEISIALTPVQLYAILNGKSISQTELASNSWNEMPGPPRGSDLARFMQPLPLGDTTAYPSYTSGSLDRQSTWNQQSHYSQPNPPGCWIPPVPRSSLSSSISSSTVNRGIAILEIIGGGLETTGGVLLILTPEPTMLTKVGGSVLAVHGADFTQAAIRQLFSGKRVEDFTEQGATWAAQRAGMSDRNAHRVGVVLDVTVGMADTIGGLTKVVAIRMGRIILSEEAVAGKMGRVSLDVEEADKAIGKEGGHTLDRHVGKSDDYIENRAMSSQDATKVFSRFASKQLAEDAINECIRMNRKAMQNWAANPNRIPKEFDLEMGRSIGDGFFNSDGTYKALTKVRVVLKFAKKGPKSFYIITAYPI